MLAHRDELLRQAAAKIAQADPTLALGVGFVQAERDDTGAPVVVASVQTLARRSRLNRLPRQLRHGRRRRGPSCRRAVVPADPRAPRTVAADPRRDRDAAARRRAPRRGLAGDRLSARDRRDDRAPATWPMCAACASASSTIDLDSGRSGGRRLRPGRARRRARAGRRARSTCSPPTASTPRAARPSSSSRPSRSRTAWPACSPTPGSQPRRSTAPRRPSSAAAILDAAAHRRHARRRQRGGAQRRVGRAVDRVHRRRHPNPLSGQVHADRRTRAADVPGQARLPDHRRRRGHRPPRPADDAAAVRPARPTRRADHGDRGA